MFIHSSACGLRKIQMDGCISTGKSTEHVCLSRIMPKRLSVFPNGVKTAVILCHVRLFVLQTRGTAPPYNPIYDSLRCLPIKAGGTGSRPSLLALLFQGVDR